MTISRGTAYHFHLLTISHRASWDGRADYKSVFLSILCVPYGVIHDLTGVLAFYKYTNRTRLYLKFVSIILDIIVTQHKLLLGKFRLKSSYVPDSSFDANSFLLR